MLCINDIVAPRLCMWLDDLSPHSLASLGRTGFLLRKRQADDGTTARLTALILVTPFGDYVNSIGLRPYISTIFLCSATPSMPPRQRCWEDSLWRGARSRRCHRFIDAVCRKALRSCAWKQSATNILRRYAASILIVNYIPRVTAATRASPEATLQKALRAYLSLQSLKSTALGHGPMPLTAKNLGYNIFQKRKCFEFNVYNLIYQ